MTIDFYYNPASAPCRAIQMTAKGLGVQLNLKFIDLKTRQNLSPEYTKLNPQRTVPTIVDDGFVLNESRAILSYLVDKYGKPDDPLYPRDPQKRALINQRLYFDMGTLYTSFAIYYYPGMFMRATEMVEANFKKIEQALDLLNTFLEGQTFAAGDTFTIADIALLASVTSFEHEEGFQLVENYPNLARWFKECKTIAPGYELNEAGVEVFKKYFALLDKFRKKC